MEMEWDDTKGETASRLRQRKFALLRRFSIPANALPGSLALAHQRCGKPNCHCAQGELHSVWSLTFMANGKKCVQHIPKDLVERIRPLVEQGREFKEATAEVFALNAQLLALWRKHLRPKGSKR